MTVQNRRRHRLADTHPALGVTWAVALLGVAMLAAGPVGLAAGVMILCGWYMAGSIAGFAIGLLALVTVEPGLPIAAVFGALLLALLCDPLGRSPATMRALAGSITTLAGLGALTGLTLSATGSWALAVLALLGGVALALYSVYRYDLVILEKL